MFSSETWSAVWLQLITYMPTVGISLALFGAFWAGGSAANRVIRRFGDARDIDANLTSLLGRSAEVGLLLFGIVTALGTLGIDVTALVAGVGLTGFALGFALKDIISNVLAGILVIVYKPFQQGDHISVKSLEGRVVEINLRYTTLTADGKTIFIPNAMVFSNAVTVGGA